MYKRTKRDREDACYQGSSMVRSQTCKRAREHQGPWRLGEYVLNLGVEAGPEGTRAREMITQQLLLLPGTVPDSRSQTLGLIERTSLSGCGPTQAP